MDESTGLENRHTGNRIVGSNPTLSAITSSHSDPTGLTFTAFVSASLIIATCILPRIFVACHYVSHSVWENMWEDVRMAKLTALSVRALTKSSRHGDGDGLFLQISPYWSKSWIQRIVINDLRRDIGLGSYPAVSLALARSLSGANRTAVSAGRDSLSEKQAAKEAARSPTPSVPTSPRPPQRLSSFADPRGATRNTRPSGVRLSKLMPFRLLGRNRWTRLPRPMRWRCSNPFGRLRTKPRRGSGSAWKRSWTGWSPTVTDSITRQERPAQGFASSQSTGETPRGSSV